MCTYIGKIVDEKNSSEIENVGIWGVNSWGILWYEKVIGLLSVTY